MWHTSEGDRILDGAEAALFRAAVLALVERVKDERNLEPAYCIQLFDELTWSQRIAVLEHVASHVLASTEKPPELTAVNEAAIGAVFEHVSFEIDSEILDTPNSCDWRKLVLNACYESFGKPVGSGDSDEDGTPIFPESPECERHELWHATIQMLADRILWDRDYEMVAEFLDEPPEKAAMLRQIMGIDDNYFVVAAQDLVSDAEVQNSLRRLSKILQ